MFQNFEFLLIFGVTILFNLTGVLCLYENSNLTEVVEDLELAINKTLAYEAPSDFTSYVETTSSTVSGKFLFKNLIYAQDVIFFS